MNFVVYENEIQFLEVYRNVIAKLMISTNLNYQIIEIDNFNKETKEKILNLDGRNIYILDIDRFNQMGMMIAREVRRFGDWHSPVILLTLKREENIWNTSKILMLDLIEKNEFLFPKLYDDLTVALEIVNQQKSFCFMMQGELYQLPHHDILYIEKCLNDNLAYIVTKTKTYPVRKTIQYLEKTLKEDTNFVKTHRSFIVNLANIQHIDFEKGIIKFDSKKQALLSRSNKKMIKQRMKVLEDLEEPKEKVKE